MQYNLCTMYYAYVIKGFKGQLSSNLMIFICRIPFTMTRVLIFESLSVTDWPDMVTSVRADSRSGKVMGFSAVITHPLCEYSVKVYICLYIYLWIVCNEITNLLVLLSNEGEQWLQRLSQL